MGAGKYRHRVTIQRRAAAAGQDALGQPEDNWENVAQPWAAVEALRGRDLQAAQQLHAEATYRVELRYRSDVTSDMQVLHGSLALQIIGQPVDPDGRRRELHLTCRQLN